MIISRYLNKEILNTLLGVTFVLLLIFLSNQLVRYLSYAAAGKVATNILFQLMGFEIPYLLALLLPLGLYLGIVLSYGRLYADSELRVLHACGLGIGRLIAMTSVLILCVTAVVTVLTFWVNPWIFAEKDTLIAHSLSTDNILDSLMPGRFQVSSDGRRVLYVEKISHNHKQATNLFIADQGKKFADNYLNTWTIVSAGIGAQTRDPVSHDRFIVAMNGNRYEGIPGQNDFKIIQFKKYAVRMPHAAMMNLHQQQESMPSGALWSHYQDPENAAELQWRISVPLSALILGLLAIPLSQVRPRHGRYSQIFPAILIYIIYVNLLFVARNWVAIKMVPPAFGMWWVHLSVLALAMIFVMNHLGWNFKQWVRRPS